jgi:DNA (cytosine-5)-methyltransferase 1
MEARGKHPDLIVAVRDLLLATGKPYVIENVDGARRLLCNPIMLCGTMFGLRVWRHRWFEIQGMPFPLTMCCRHDGYPVVVSGSTHGRGEATVPEMIEALAVPWMAVRGEVRQAIPPAYTEWIGRKLLEVWG